MTDKIKPTTIQIITKGYVMANIPTILICFLIWFGLWKIFNLNYVISVFIGSMAGWYYWTFSIKKWVKWSYLNGIDKEKILTIGRLSLLLWYKSTIDNALADENK